MIIAAFVLAACVLTLVLTYLVLRQGATTEPAPFRIEDAYSDVPEIRVARARAMAIPRKHATLRSRSSR